MNPAGSQTGQVVVISGPSGSGKTTVCAALAGDPGVVRSVSATTRDPRPGEQGGVDYYFLSRDAFREQAGRGEFVEHAEYNGELYGTPQGPLEGQLADGRTVLLEIDVQGAAQLRRTYPDGVYIFLDAPDRAEAMARLEHRATETPEERRRRLEAAERELEQKGLFDHVVVNADLAETVARVRQLIHNGRAPRGAPEPTTEDVLDG